MGKFDKLFKEKCSEYGVFTEEGDMSQMGGGMDANMGMSDTGQLPTPKGDAAPQPAQGAETQETDATVARLAKVLFDALSNTDEGVKNKISMIIRRTDENKFTDKGNALGFLQEVENALRPTNEEDEFPERTTESDV